MKTLLLVRHANIDTQTPRTDATPLTPAGQIRANEFARIGVSAGAMSVYHSGVVRTEQTAAPLAAARSLTAKKAPNVVADPVAFKTEVMSAVAGAVVVVVGHSNTVRLMVEALGATFPGADIDDTEFDNLFVVMVPAQGETGVVRLKYGAAT